MRAALFVTLGIAGIAGTAGAQCKTDVECKGDRICVNGVCETPAARAADAAAPRGAQASTQGPGWAQTAGFLGIGSAVTVLSLALAAEVTKEDQIPSIPLGGAATLILAAMGPIVEAGATSATGEGVIGNPGLRIAGWVFYGISLADALVLIGLGIGEVTPPSGLITSVGVLGAGSLSFFAVDALTAASSAEAARPRHARRFTPVPLAGSAIDARGRRVGTVGLGFRF